jgi:hypothetical protein
LLLKVGQCLLRLSSEKSPNPNIIPTLTLTDSSPPTDQVLDTAGVGFGPDGITQLLGEDLVGGKLLDNIRDIDPLDLMFEGDDEEEPEEDAQFKFKNDYNKFKFSDSSLDEFSDLDIRRKLGLLLPEEENDDRIKEELSNLISDIGNIDTIESEGYSGSRKDRRAKKYGDRGEDSKGVSNMMNEIRRTEKGDNTGLDAIIRDLGFANRNYEGIGESAEEKAEMDAVYKSLEMYSGGEYDVQEVEDEVEIGIEEEVREEEGEEVVNENREEDIEEEEYSMIGDD